MALQRESLQKCQFDIDDETINTLDKYINYVVEKEINAASSIIT